MFGNSDPFTTLERINAITEFVRTYGTKLKTYFIKGKEVEEATRSDLKDFMGSLVAIANDPDGSAKSIGREVRGPYRRGETPRIDLWLVENRFSNFGYARKLVHRQFQIEESLGPVLVARDRLRFDFRRSSSWRAKTLSSSVIWIGVLR